MPKKMDLMVESCRRLLRKNARSHLENLLSKLHPADIAILLGRLNRQERDAIFSMLPPDIAAKALVDMDSLLQTKIMEDMPSKELAQVLAHLPADEAVGLLDNLSDEKKEEMIPLMEGQEGVSRLMLYEEETAGRIMTTDFLALPEELTVEQAIQKVRGAKEKEVFYIYVVDKRNHLVGVISLRQLILADPETPLREVMNPDVISVRADMDQEEVARIVARYDILAVPVVDEKNHLIGMVTVDDVINIIQDEATEDIYKMVGASEEELWEASTLKIAGYRLPWLSFTIIGEMVSGLVLKYYHHTISTLVAVSFFVPLIMALSGAVGNQTQTIIVRAMATGRMEGMAWKILRRQLSVGAIMGLAAGTLAWAMVMVVQHNYLLGLSVGISLLVSMSISSVIGVAVPMAANKIGVDPALTVPSIATLNDIMGTFIYLTLATYLLMSAGG